MSLLDAKEDFEADLKDRMEQFIDGNGSEQQHEEDLSKSIGEGDEED